MRSLRTLILILFSLFPLLSWSEEKLNFDWEKTNFQEMICYCEKCRKSTIELDLGQRIFVFLEEVVVGISVETMGTDKVHVIEHNYGQYKRFPTAFFWTFENETLYTLDRQSLKLVRGSSLHNREELYTCHITMPACFGDLCIGIGDWKSDLIDGYKNGHVDELILLRQKELDEEMAKNKI